MPESQERITLLLQKWTGGDEDALNVLVPAVFDELRRIARSKLRKERPGHSFKSTDLVNEAYLKLVRQDQIDWESRAHFYGICATLMRQILVDHAKKKMAKKKKPGQQKVTLREAIVASNNEVKIEYMIDLDEVLKRLAEVRPRQALVVEYKVFVEMTVPEIAQVLGVGPATVKRDWRAAKAWLQKELAGVRG